VGLRYVASVRAATDCDLELPLAYFPGWRLRLDGTEQPAGNLSAAGRMRLRIGPGNHRVEATFEETPLRWAADLTSVAALLLTVAFAVVTRRA
jgi:uncharacterized membrane protein YfhO